MLARAGTRHVVLDTDGDWIMPLARALGRPRPRRAA
jgi:hypothetical protein